MPHIRGWVGGREVGRVEGEGGGEGGWLTMPVDTGDR